MGGADNDEEAEALGGGHEKQRRAGMVNAVLAAANARRIDVPLSEGGSVHRQLAESRDPLHQFRMDAKWADRVEKVPDNIFKKIGIDAPEPPRRL